MDAIYFLSLRVVAVQPAECCITQEQEKHIGRVGTVANRRRNLELMARKPRAEFGIGGAQRLTRQKRPSSRSAHTLKR